MAKLSNLSLNHRAVHRPRRKKEKSKQELVIESDNIEGDRVCCIQLLQCWNQKKWIRRSFLRCRGSRLTLLSMMTDISRHFKVPWRHKAVQVVRKYSKAYLYPLEAIESLNTRVYPF